MAKSIHYSEPADYFPKSVRKELKIGEYAPKAKTAAGATKKATTKKATTKKATNTKKK